MYVACYVPLVAAAREQVRTAGMPIRTTPTASDSLVHALPYTAMLVAFLVLVYFARAEIGGPIAAMTMVVFVLTLLLMVRQGAMMRDDARVRERRATEMVEARYASLIANASDVIMIVAPDGTLRFASPAFERTFGLQSRRECRAQPVRSVGRRGPRRAADLPGRRGGERRRRRRAGRAAAATRRSPLHARDRRQQPDRRPGRAGTGARPARHQRAQGRSRKSCASWRSTTR